MAPEKIDLILPSDEHPVVIYSDGDLIKPCRHVSDVAVFPGSFNPLHDGHLKLRDLAARKLKREVVYEISLANVEKQNIDASAVRRRLKQFSNATVALTRSPRFFEKSKLFPSCPFVVGFDTAQRILDPRFYDNREDCRDVALRDLRDTGHTFFVGGRLMRLNNQDRFGGGSDLEVPPEFRLLFEFVSEEEFRVDVSSTAIRQQKSGE